MQHHGTSFPHGEVSPLWEARVSQYSCLPVTPSLGRAWSWGGMVGAAPRLDQPLREVFLKCRFKDVMLLKFVLAMGTSLIDTANSWERVSAKAVRVKAKSTTWIQALQVCSKANHRSGLWYRCLLNGDPAHRTGSASKEGPREAPSWLMISKQGGHTALAAHYV